MYRAVVHGYAAFERVVAEIRPPERSVAASQPALALGPDVVALIVTVDDEPPSSSSAARLRDALADAREAWAQTTFYLFDPVYWG